MVTTRLKPGFITSNLLTAEDQICGQVLFWLPMKRMSSLILLLVRLVFRRCEFLVVFAFRTGAGLWQKRWGCGQSRIKRRGGPGQFLLEGPYDVIYDVIVCKKWCFRWFARFPFVFSGSGECAYSNAHTVNCENRIYDM